MGLNDSVGVFVGVMDGVTLFVGVGVNELVTVGLGVIDGVGVFVGVTVGVMQFNDAGSP